MIGQWTTSAWYLLEPEQSRQRTETGLGRWEPPSPLPDDAPRGTDHD